MADYLDRIKQMLSEAGDSVSANLKEKDDMLKAASHQVADFARNPDRKMSDLDTPEQQALAEHSLGAMSNIGSVAPKALQGVAAKQASGLADEFANYVAKAKPVASDEAALMQQGLEKLRSNTQDSNAYLRRLREMMKGNK